MTRFNKKEFRKHLNEGNIEQVENTLKKVKESNKEAKEIAEREYKKDDKENEKNKKESDYKISNFKFGLVAIFLGTVSFISIVFSGNINNNNQINEVTFKEKKEVINILDLLDISEEDKAEFIKENSLDVIHDGECNCEIHGDSNKNITKDIDKNNVNKNLDNDNDIDDVINSIINDNSNNVNSDSSSNVDKKLLNEFKENTIKKNKFKKSNYDLYDETALKIYLTTNNIREISPIKILLKRFVEDAIDVSDNIIINGDLHVFKNRIYVTSLKGDYEIKKDFTDEYTFLSQNEKPLIIKNKQRIPKWTEDLEYNDNKFLGTITVRKNKDNNNEIEYINEIDLELYLKGIGETTGNTSKEKMKTMAILSRGYANFYMKSKVDKFENKDYHLEDDPRTSQKYIGFNYHKRNPKWLEAIEDTEKLVIYKKEDNTYFISPYSTCTTKNEKGEVKRKSLEEANWGDVKEKFGTNILQSINDEIGECKPTQVAGHQVGLSGNGSEVLAAEKGYTYDQIINYYYKNIYISKITY